MDVSIGEDTWGPTVWSQSNCAARYLVAYSTKHNNLDTPLLFQVDVANATAGRPRSFSCELLCCKIRRKVLPSRFGTRMTWKRSLDGETVLDDVVSDDHSPVGDREVERERCPVGRFSHA